MADDIERGGPKTEKIKKSPAQIAEEMGLKGLDIPDHIQGWRRGVMEVMTGVKPKLSPEDKRGMEEDIAQGEREADLLDKVEAITKVSEWPFIEIRTYMVDGEEVTIDAQDIELLKKIMEDDRSVERDPEEILKLNGFILIGAGVLEGKEMVSFACDMRQYENMLQLHAQNYSTGITETLKLIARMFGEK